MLVGSWRALARGLVFAASLVAPTLGLAQPQPQGAAYAAAPFAFQRLDIDQSGLQPAVCLRFTGALRGEGVRNSDYVAIAPDPRPGLRVEGQALCLTGLSYGSAYEIGSVQNSSSTQTRPLPPPQLNEARYGQYAERVDIFQDVYSSSDRISIGARREGGYVVTPSAQWTSLHLVHLFDSDRGTYDSLIIWVSAARRGDVQAQNALADTAPASCNRNWECFGNMMSESARMIRARQPGAR